MSGNTELMKTYLAGGRYAITELKADSEPGRQVAVLRHVRGGPIGDKEEVSVPLLDTDDTEFASGKMLWQTNSGELDLV